MARSSELLLFLLAASATFSSLFGESVNFRWCAKGKDEMEKCKNFTNALENGLAASTGSNIQPDCVDGGDAEGCMKKIKDGQADLVKLGGVDIYTAGQTYEMVPVVAEDYQGDGVDPGTKYYAVAIAKANNTAVTLGNLKGKKSCHTGYQRTAGYIVPAGYFLHNGQMMRVACGANGTLESLSKFFSQSCIGGIPSQFQDGNLCALCRPEGNCKGDSTNRFYGHGGAFKCMFENIGDVAFVKHLTSVQMVEKGTYGKLDDYVYLCNDNTRKVVTADSHKECNVARVPSEVVMTRPGNNIEVYKKVLLKASELCQGNSSATNCSGFSIFESGAKSSLLFRDDTKKLIDVGEQNTYRKWMGDSYYNSVDGLHSCPTVQPTSSAAPLGPGPALALIAASALVMRFVQFSQHFL